MNLKTLKQILILLAAFTITKQKPFLEIESKQGFRTNPLFNNLSLIEEFRGIRLNKYDKITLNILENFEYEMLHNPKLKSN